MNTLDELKTKLIDMDVQKVVDLTKRALDEGFSAEEILGRALIPAMDIVGDKFECGERFLPEMLLSANAMKEAMRLLRPLLARAGAKTQAKVVMGSVEGDLHDIGLNIVSAMLEGGGFDVYNLGTDVPAEQFVNAVREHNASLLGMSALLTTTMLNMKVVIEELHNSGIRDRVKVMVGGAQVTQDFVNEIGADGSAVEAGSAVKLARQLSAQPST